MTIYAYLKHKDIQISRQRYGIDLLNFMALGLFSSLILGLIIKNLGNWLDIPFLIDIGTKAQSMMGASVGVGVAYALKAPPLVLFASCITGLMGAEAGGAVGALVSAVIGAEFGKLISRTTPMDIVITPLGTAVVGAIGAYLVSPVVALLMTSLGAIIMWGVALSPFVMSILVAIFMGLLLTLPVSSAAIAISLGLSGLSAGAATVGCACQMIGFAVMSYKDNGIGVTVACGLGTSMIQMPNILKNPKIWLPPTLSGAILAPIATLVFGMQNIPSGAGMGTSALVGQVSTLSVMGMDALLPIVLLHFILPAILTSLISHVMYKKGYIKKGDLKIN